MDRPGDYSTFLGGQDNDASVRIISGPAQREKGRLVLKNEVVSPGARSLFLSSPSFFS